MTVARPVIRARVDAQRFGVLNRDSVRCLRMVAPTTPSEEARSQKSAALRPVLPMKHIFTKQNLSTFLVASLAVTAAIVIIIPLVRKFVPGLKKTTTTTTPAA